MLLYDGLKLGDSSILFTMDNFSSYKNVTRSIKILISIPKFFPPFLMLIKF